jgi:hypothetical protein
MANQGDDTDPVIIELICRMIKAGAFDHEEQEEGALEICSARSFGYLQRLITRAKDTY